MATKGRAVPETNGKVEIVTVTPASAWRKQALEGELYRLPGSGNVVKLKRPGLKGMVTRAGHVPNPLSRQVLTFLAKLGEVPNADDDDEVKIKHTEEHAEAAMHLLELTFVEPRIVSDREPNYANGEIAPEVIPDFDVNWVIYSFLEGDAERLAEFRVDTSTGTSGLPSAALRTDANADSVSGSA